MKQKRKLEGRVNFRQLKASPFIHQIPHTADYIVNTDLIYNYYKPRLQRMVDSITTRITFKNFVEQGSLFWEFPLTYEKDIIIKAMIAISGTSQILAKCALQQLLQRPIWDIFFQKVMTKGQRKHFYITSPQFAFHVFLPHTLLDIQHYNGVDKDFYEKYRTYILNLCWPSLEEINHKIDTEIACRKTCLTEKELPTRVSSPTMLEAPITPTVSKIPSNEPEIQPKKATTLYSIHKICDCSRYTFTTNNTLNSYD